MAALPLFHRQKPPPVPAWAIPLDAEQFSTFCSALSDALAPYGGHTLGDGAVVVPGRSSQYGLTNLVQQWARLAPPERATLITGHFQALFAAEDAQPVPPDRLLGLVRPRLWNSEMVAGVDFPLITRPVAEDLDAVLCVDRPTAVANLKPDEADELGLSTSDLWDHAIAQIDDGLPVSTAELEDGATALAGDSFFIASRLLDLERFAGELPPHGALVAVPHRHLLLTSKIESTRVVGVLNTMVVGAERLHREGPGSIVPHVYWWRHAEPPLRIPATITEHEVVLVPPDEFVEMLNDL
jgi:hypothetical protein